MSIEAMPRPFFPERTPQTLVCFLSEKTQIVQKAAFATVEYLCEANGNLFALCFTFTRLNA